MGIHKKTGSISSANSVRPMIGGSYMTASGSYVRLNNGFDVSYTIATTGNYSVLRLHNSSNPATGSNYTALTELYVNGV